MKISSKSLAQTEEVAAQFVENLLSREASTHALIVALHGDLGAGKTTFTKGVAKALGIQDVITSPTFVIEKIYKLQNTKYEHLIHIDAYRLESGKELLHLGWKEISENEKNIIFIEWPEKVAEILPEDMIQVSFQFIDEETRDITF